MAQMNSATYGIDPIFDQFYQALETAFIGEIQLPDGKPNPKFSWLHAADYAVDMSSRIIGIANSDENRMRLASSSVVGMTSATI